MQSPLFFILILLFHTHHVTYGADTPPNSPKLARRLHIMSQEQLIEIINIQNKRIDELNAVIAQQGTRYDKNLKKLNAKFLKLGKSNKKQAIILNQLRQKLNDLNQ